MADKKISQLTALTGPGNSDELAIVDTGASETKKITYSNLFSGTSGAVIANTSNIATNTSSMATVQTSYDAHADDVSIHFTSNAIWTEFSNTSGAITKNTSSCATLREDLDAIGGDSWVDASSAVWSEINNASEAIIINTSSRAVIQTSYDAHADDTTIHFTNPGFFDQQTDVDHDQITNTHNLTTDIDHNQLTNYSINSHFTSDAIWSSMAFNTDEIIQASSAIINNTSNLSTHTADGTIHFTSNAIWTEFSNSSGAITYNAALSLINYFNQIGTSGAVTANTTHRKNTSNPHSAYTTQTGTASFATVKITGDQSSSGVAYAPNVVFNTTSGGVTASNYTIGSLLVVYE